LASGGGQRIEGLEAPDPAAEFAGDVGVAFKVGKYAGWKTVIAGDLGEGAAPTPAAPVLPGALPVGPGGDADGAR
jgi:hypothetical protein